MKTIKLILFLVIATFFNSIGQAAASPPKRLLWASINGREDAYTTRDATLKTILKGYNNQILVTWRMFPTDDATTGFDLYRKSGTGAEVKLNSSPIVKVTNFQDAGANRLVDNTYRLCEAGSTVTLDTYTIKAAQASAALPYLSVPLHGTSDVDPLLVYNANDASVGDLDGDGVPEIILKRLVATDEVDAQATIGVRHPTLLEAYKLNGAFMWRVKLGPNVLVGNGCSFAVNDFNSDGKCEIGIRTAEGTVFGDGTEIGDTDGDGKTDYRVDGKNYVQGGPEFLSVIEGATGKELARSDYIALGTTFDWGDDYYKRSSSYRIGMGNFSGANTSILICRGVYAKMVLEAWDFKDGKLTKRWRFDTSDGVYGAYAGQGYHSLSVGDVDDDGFDEVVYGSCTIDHDGSGLNNSGFGHGDALHLGKFDPSRSGMQIWSCFETSTVCTAFRDAKTGDVIWKYEDPLVGDVGRALIADIDPDSPGCEMWWYQSNAYSCKGEDLGYKPSSSNMAIWWTGSLNRQLLNESAINSEKKSEGFDRMFTIYRYDVTTVNGTKSNPCFYGDITGDWREEIIMITKDSVNGVALTPELRIFSTWYPCDYKFPYLMSDHVYEMSALNQNIGYNQPTQLGYYLGSDLIKNSLPMGLNGDTIVNENNATVVKTEYYDIFGRRVQSENVNGILIRKRTYDDGRIICDKVILRR